MRLKITIVSVICLYEPDLLVSEEYYKFERLISSKTEFKEIKLKVVDTSER